MKEENKLILKYIGERLRMFRQERSLSREAAADLLGVTKRTVASYERGEREMTMDMAIRMAHTYDTTYTNLTDYKNVLDGIGCTGNGSVV